MPYESNTYIVSLHDYTCVIIILHDNSGYHLAPSCCNIIVVLFTGDIP